MNNKKPPMVIVDSLDEANRVMKEFYDEIGEFARKVKARNRRTKKIGIFSHENSEQIK